MTAHAIATASFSKSDDNGEIVLLDKTSRLDENTYRNYKWHDWNSESIAYGDVINFKRSSNPRGCAHHCVMCGDKNAAIPSQNKDVCKTCDTGFWLVKETQVVVKFCKGCKNFARLWDFRDKPEATKCIKCRQRGRLNYFSKKSGEGDEGFLDGQWPNCAPLAAAEFDARMAGNSSETGRFSSKGTTRRPRGDSLAESSNYYSSVASSESMALGTFGSYKTTGDFVSAGRPGTRARSATLGSSDLRDLHAYTYNFAADRNDPELKDAATMLLAASKVPSHTKSYTSSENSPRAALLSAAASSQTQPHLLAMYGGEEKTAEGVWANMNTGLQLQGKKASSNALLQLAQLTEHILEAEHILHIGGNGVGEGRQRSNTLDLGSLSTLARMSSFMTSGANTVSVKAEKASLAGREHERYLGSDINAESSIPLMLNLRRKIPVPETVMHMRAAMVIEAARDMEKTELATTTAKELIENTLVDSGRKVGEKMPPLSIDSNEAKPATRSRANSLGNEFSLSNRPRSVSEYSADTGSGVTSTSASSASSIDDAENMVNSKLVRKRASSICAISSPMTVKTEFSRASRSSTRLESKSNKLHAITPVSIEADPDRDLMDVVSSRKRLCSRSNSVGGDDMLIG